MVRWKGWCPVGRRRARHLQSGPRATGPPVRKHSSHFLRSGTGGGGVSGGGATRPPPPARPARSRPTDPQALLALLAIRQGEALDRLGREVRGLSRPGDPVTREVAGSRAVANLVTQLVARAERSVEGVMALELWRPTLPAWRRAAGRARSEERR